MPRVPLKGRVVALLPDVDPNTRTPKWSVTRDFMTMRKVGLVQDIPNGAKRAAQAWPESSNTTLVGRSGAMDLAQLRALQDWFLKYELKSVPNVSEVASIGALVKQYQIVRDRIYTTL